MNNFNGKVAVITGAGSGIGRALARQLSSEGAFVIIADKNPDTLQETRVLIEKEQGKVLDYAIDVSDKIAMEELKNKVIQETGKVHILINNAGIALDQHTVEDLTIEEFEHLFGINIWGVIYGTKAFLPELKKQEEAYIVNISSVFGLFGVAKMAPYTTSKFAVKGFTESLIAELVDTNVKAMSVHPGGIQTNIVQNAPSRNEDEAVRQEKHKQFLKAARTSAESAATQIIKGMKQRKERILIGFDARVIDFIVRWFPRRAVRLLNNYINKVSN